MVAVSAGVRRGRSGRPDTGRAATARGTGPTRAHWPGSVGPWPGGVLAGRSHRSLLNGAGPAAHCLTAETPRNGRRGYRRRYRPSAEPRGALVVRLVTSPRACPKGAPPWPQRGVHRSPRTRRTAVSLAVPWPCETDPLPSVSTLSGSGQACAARGLALWL